MLKPFFADPYDLPIAMYFASLARLNYVNRVTHGVPFTETEITFLQMSRELEEDW